MRFDGKVAIVTGAGAGIGQATAIRLFAGGASLVLNDLDDARLGETVRRLGPGADSRAVTRVGSVAEEATARALADEAVGRFGRLDILVNNAGIHHVGDLTETSLEDWRRVIDNNLTSMFLCSKHAIPIMVRQKSGAIVNLASISSFVGQEFGDRSTFLYNITKAGARQLTTSLATRYAADNVRVNCVCPGGTRTATVRFDNDAEADRFWGQVGLAHPLGRAARPEEIAAAIAFLASDDASFMTGSAVVVDGGYLAR